MDSRDDSMILEISQEYLEILEYLPSSSIELDAKMQAVDHRSWELMIKSLAAGNWNSREVIGV